MGNDGYYVAEKLLFYTAMARDAGWGKEIPEMLRNSDMHQFPYLLLARFRLMWSGVNVRCNHEFPIPGARIMLA